MADLGTQCTRCSGKGYSGNLVVCTKCNGSGQSS
jgi:hypothetical protein